VKQTELASVRRYKDITQQEMAKLLNLSVNGYSKKERGVNEFTLNEMFIISSEFGRQIEDIFLPTDSTLRVIDKAE